MRAIGHSANIPMEDYERLRKGLARYEYVRALTPQKFASLWELCIKDGIPFDKQIDAEIAYELQKSHERRLRESIGPGWKEKENHG